MTRITLAASGLVVAVGSMLAVLLGSTHDASPTVSTPTPAATSAHDYEMADCAAHLNTVCLTRGHR